MHQVRDHQADHVGAPRDQTAGNPVRPVVQLPCAFQDAGAGRCADVGVAAQSLGHGHQRDPQVPGYVYHSNAHALLIIAATPGGAKSRHSKALEDWAALYSPLRRPQVQTERQVEQALKPYVWMLAKTRLRARLFPSPCRSSTRRIRWCSRGPRPCIASPPGRKLRTYRTAWNKRAA